MKKTLLVLSVLSFSMSAPAADRVPMLMSYRGAIGILPPDTHSVDLEFALFDGPEGGNAVWTESHPGADLRDGQFAVTLGSITPMPDDLFAGPVRYLSVSVNGNEVVPPTLLVSVPYAIQAGTAGGSPNALEAADGEPAEAVFVDSEGRTGIGSTSPEAPLVVNGMIRSTTGGIVYPDGSVQETAIDTATLDEILARLTLLEAAVANKRSRE